MWKLWNPSTKKIIRSRDATFVEDQFLPPSAFSNLPTEASSNLQITFTDFPDSESEPEDLDDLPAPVNPVNTSNDNESDQIPDLVDSDNGFITPKRHSTPPITSTSSKSSPVTIANRYSLLDDPDSDSDDEDDIYGIPITTPASDAPASDAPASDAPANDAPASDAPASDASASDAPATAPTTEALATSSATASNPSQATSTRPVRTIKPSPTAIEAAESDRYLQEQRSRRSKPKAKVTSTTATTSSSSILPQEPKPSEESKPLPDAHKWDEAKLEEINSLDQLGAWKLVPRPTNQRVLTSKFVCKLKDPHTTNPRHKARLVARGYEEIPGVDYTDTYAPVVKASSVRTVLAISAIQKRHLRQFDVKTAYLNAHASQTSYMEQPEGFEIAGYPREDWVLEILKSLYGRHSSGREWYGDLQRVLTSLNFTRSDADECIFILNTPERSIIIAVYVDDFLISARSPDDTEWLHTELNKHWDTRDLGPAKRFLGIDIYRPDPTGPVFINQGVYIRQILHEFGMEDCNPVKTPLDISIKLHKRYENEPQTNAEEYRKMVGKYMHLLYTRVDIACAVSKLAQYLSDPSEDHMRQAKHLQRYLKGTLDHGIEYSASPDLPQNDLLITGYCDASFDDDPDTSRSTSGQTFMLGNGSISHCSNKQSCVAMSSMESEYMVMSEAAKEAISLQYLLESLQITYQRRPIPLKTDSTAAYDHVRNNVNHSKTKHIHRRHNFIREACINGEITLERIPAELQTADILTKVLPRQKHDHAMKLLNMKSFHIPTD